MAMPVGLCIRGEERSVGFTTADFAKLTARLTAVLILNSWNVKLGLDKCLRSRPAEGR